MPAAKVPRQGVHSPEINGQRTRPGKWFPTRHAFSCRDSLWGRLHELHGPFLPGSKTRFGSVMSPSFSFLQMSARTPSCFLILTHAMEGGFPTVSKLGKSPEWRQITQTLASRSDSL